VQMDQIWLESSQSAPEFLNLILEFAFYVRSFATFKTQVNVHVRLGIGSRSHTEGPKALITRKLYTCC
jgi:hypothetical protein